MFGTVSPNPRALPCSQRHAWRRLYCGTCKGLHTYGTATRALTSYDAVLLGALIEGLSAAASPRGSCRCPLNPLVFRPIVAPDSVATQVSAAVQILLADAWLSDRSEDGLAALSLLRAAIPSGDAAQALRDLGIDPDPIVAITAAQARIEARPPERVTAPAEPTAQMLAHLFRSLPDLPGTDPALQTASARRALAAMGSDLGLSIYLIDALEDLEEDACTGAFNPCLDPGSGLPDRVRVEAAGTALRQATERLSEAIASFPWRRNAGLLEHVIGTRLPGVVVRATAAAEEALAQAALAPRPSWPRLALAWRRIRSLWRWGSGLVIRAIRPTPPRDPDDPRRRQGHGGPDAGDATDHDARKRKRSCGECHACDCGDCCQVGDCCCDRGCCDRCCDCGPGDSGCVDCCPCDGCSCDC